MDMSHSFVRISQSEENPAKVLEQLKSAEVWLRAGNYSFDANVMAQAQQTIIQLIKYADELVDCVEWNRPPDSVIAEYIHYRGYTIQVEKENDIHEEDS
jgi:hypothetical protein